MNWSDILEPGSFVSFDKLREVSGDLGASNAELFQQVSSVFYGAGRTRQGIAGVSLGRLYKLSQRVCFDNGASLWLPTIKRVMGYSNGQEAIADIRKLHRIQNSQTWEPRLSLTDIRNVRFL